MFRDVFPLFIVAVVKATWEKDAEFLEFYSDVADASIPTVSVGVPNTERGDQKRPTCSDACKSDLLKRYDHHKWSEITWGSFSRESIASYKVLS